MVLAAGSGVGGRTVYEFGLDCAKGGGVKMSKHFVPRFPKLNVSS